MNQPKARATSKNGHASPPSHILEATLEIWRQTDSQHLIPIVGRSMLPFLREGDYVVVSHSQNSIKRGDIIVFKQAGTLVAHRVMRLQNGATFITKGDNTPHFDPPVEASQMVGRVLTVKRNNHATALDTPVWRVVGWLIVITTLTWHKLYSLGNRLGLGPNRVTGFLRRLVWAVSVVALKGIKKLFWRGR